LLSIRVALYAVYLTFIMLTNISMVNITLPSLAFLLGLLSWALALFSKKERK